MTCHLAARYLCVVSIASASVLSAQTIPVRSASPAECAEAIDSIRVMRAPAMWPTLVQCGAAGRDALVVAWSRVGSGTTDVELEALLKTAYLVRDRRIFGEAARIASNRMLGTLQRNTGIAALVSQFNPATRVRLTVSLSNVIAGRATGTCPFAPFGSAALAYREALLPDSAAMFAAALDSARRQSSAPQSTRELADCARGLFSSVVPITVPPNLITLTYLCGTTFRLRNASDDWLEAEYDVYNTSEREWLSVRPRGEIRFATDRTGTVRIFHAGRLVQTKANGNRPCSTGS